MNLSHVTAKPLKVEAKVVGMIALIDLCILNVPQRCALLEMFAPIKESRDMSGPRVWKDS